MLSINFPYLVNPDARDDGWSYVSPIAWTSLPAITLPADIAAAARYLDIELNYNLNGAAEPDYVLALNGSSASRGSCSVRSWIVATEQTPRRPATINFGGAQAGDPVYMAKATLELVPGRHRLFTAESTTTGGSFTNEASEVTGFVNNEALVISTVQVLGTAVNNIAIGSRWRLVLRK